MFIIIWLGVWGSNPDSQIQSRPFACDEYGNKPEEVSYGEGGDFESRVIFTRSSYERGNWAKDLVSSASNWDAEVGLSTPVHGTRRRITCY